MAPAIPVIMAFAAAASVGTSIYEMTNQQKAPTAPKQPDTTAQAAQSQAEALLKRRGMANTMLSNPMNPGVAAPTQKATLG